MLLHQDRMLNSSSSSTPSSSSSSSLLLSCNRLPKHPVDASISNHHLQHLPPLHPTPWAPLPHYHHPHHLQAYPSIISTHHLHHLHQHPSANSSHRLYSPSPSQSSTPPKCALLDPQCQAPINANVSQSVINPCGFASETDDGNHNFNVDPQCDTTDCSPRSVIRHVHSSSSAPSPNSSRPSCHHANPSTNYSGSSPSTTSLHDATTNLSMTRHPTLRETSPGDLKLVHKQSAAVDHRHLPPPWSSPTATHHLHCAELTNSQLPSKDSGHIKHEARTAEGNDGGEVRKSPKLRERGGSRSADLHRQTKEIGQFKSCYPSRSAEEEDKPLHDAAGCESIAQPTKTAMALRMARNNLNVNGNKCPAAKPMYHSIPNVMQTEHGHKLHIDRSFSCDLHCSKYSAACTNPCASWRQCAGGLKQDGNIVYNGNEPAPQRPEALLGYVDGLAGGDSHCNAKLCAQLGSKWEDAEKWVRPASNDHYASGCSGFANKGFLNMSNCINGGTSIKSHYSTAHVPPAKLSVDYSSNCSSGCATTDCADYNTNRSFDNCNSAGLPAQHGRIVNQPLLTRQILHADRFNPHLTSPNPSLPYAKPFLLSPHLAPDQEIREQLLNYQHVQKNYTENARQEHYASSDSGIGKPVGDKHKLVPQRGVGNQVMRASKKEGSHGSGWSVFPLNPQYLLTPSHPFTDRFASGEVMPCAASQYVYASHNDENSLMRPIAQESVHVSMVSLREVGTQISSVDGSGSVSRFTSKSGSPQKPMSPARHTTPARMRSLNGSTKTINSTKEAIDLEELLECHRAKLELQALSEGEHIHSFHRTTSNWSSREMEEADLSRSLRHSTELDDTKTYPWPNQSYSWKKDEDSKLAKLQIKEARIQAWEEKKKNKADAQLKRLEESLARRRSQTTNRIMRGLEAAHKKAEDMRARVHAELNQGTKKAHKFRHRSLSPLSRCTCFSPLQ